MILQLIYYLKIHCGTSQGSLNRITDSFSEMDTSDFRARSYNTSILMPLHLRKGKEKKKSLQRKVDTDVSLSRSDIIYTDILSDVKQQAFIPTTVQEYADEEIDKKRLLTELQTSPLDLSTKDSINPKSSEHSFANYTAPRSSYKPSLQRKKSQKSSQCIGCSFCKREKAGQFSSYIPEPTIRLRSKYSKPTLTSSKGKKSLVNNNGETSYKSFLHTSGSKMILPEMPPLKKKLRKLPELIPINMFNEIKESTNIMDPKLKLNSHLLGKGLRNPEQKLIPLSKPSSTLQGSQSISTERRAQESDKNGFVLDPREHFFKVGLPSEKQLKSICDPNKQSSIKILDLTDDPIPLKTPNPFEDKKLTPSPDSEILHQKTNPLSYFSGADTTKSVSFEKSINQSCQIMDSQHLREGNTTTVEEVPTFTSLRTELELQGNFYNELGSNLSSLTNNYSNNSLN